MVMVVPVILSSSLTLKAISGDLIGSTCDMGGAIGLDTIVLLGVNAEYHEVVLREDETARHLSMVV